MIIHCGRGFPSQVKDRAAIKGGGLKILWLRPSWVQIPPPASIVVTTNGNQVPPNGNSNLLEDCKSLLVKTDWNDYERWIKGGVIKATVKICSTTPENSIFALFK